MALYITLVLKWLALLSLVSSLNVQERTGEIINSMYEDDIDGGTEYKYQNFDSGGMDDHEYDYNHENQLLGPSIPVMTSRSSSIPSQNLDKAIEILIKSLTYVSTAILKPIEPISFQMQENVTLKSPDYKLICSINHVTFNSSSKLTASRIISDVDQNRLEFEFHLPMLNTTETTYQLNGRVHGMPINVKGDVSSNVTDLNVNGSLTYGLVKKVPQIKRLQMDYDFNSLSIAVTNLTIPFVPESQINAMVSSMASEYLKKNEKPISKRTSRRLKNKINMKIRTLLKGVISNTAEMISDYISSILLLIPLENLMVG